MDNFSRGQYILTAAGSGVGEAPEAANSLEFRQMRLFAPNAAQERYLYLAVPKYPAVLRLQSEGTVDITSDWIVRAIPNAAAAA